MIVPVALGELVECQWCATLMAKTEADVICVVCSSSFADRLLPTDACLWDESGIPPVILNSEFEDSKYGSVEDDRSESSTKDQIDAGTGGCEEYDDCQPNCKMYAKLAAV